MAYDTFKELYLLYQPWQKVRSWESYWARHSGWCSSKAAAQSWSCAAPHTAQTNKCWHVGASWARLSCSTALAQLHCWGTQWEGWTSCSHQMTCAKIPWVLSWNNSGGLHRSHLLRPAHGQSCSTCTLHWPIGGLCRAGTCLQQIVLPLPWPCLLLFGPVWFQTWFRIPIFGSNFWDPHWKRNSDFVFNSKDSGQIFFWIPLLKIEKLEFRFQNSEFRKKWA